MSVASDKRVEPQQGWLDRRFKITERGSTKAREVRGGLVTFFAMAYIIALNPLIIGTTTDVSGRYLGGGDAPNLVAVAACTALVASIASILMGLLANFPIALATGLGLNAFVAYGIASMVTWEQAMGMVVWEGLIITVLVLTRFREAVFRAIPLFLKFVIAISIGGFLIYIATVNGGVVRRATSGAVPSEFGIHGALWGLPMLVFAVTLFLGAGLILWKVKGALLITILGGTAFALLGQLVFKVGPQTPDGSNPAGWALNVPSMPDSIIAVPDFSLLGRIDMFGAFPIIGPIAFGIVVFSLLIADFFDTMGTVTGVGEEAGLLDERGTPPNLRRILLVDSIAALGGGLGSVSSNTSYVESTAGVAEGARTGIASIVTGALFLLSMWFAPLVSMIPSEAAMPALVLVGIIMFTGAVGNVEWTKREIGFPAAMTLFFMVITFSITIGMGAGFITYVIVQILRGKLREVHPLMYLIAGAFVIYFVAPAIL